MIPILPPCLSYNRGQVDTLDNPIGYTIDQRLLIGLRADQPQGRTASSHLGKVADIVYCDRYTADTEICL
jgi:hypothetical protein